MARSEALEAARILGRYRRLVLLGRARLAFEAARTLVGPDCAYHLYFRHLPHAAPPPPRTRAARGQRRGSRAASRRGENTRDGRRG